ncbi:MAG: cell division protein FtsZ, partial [Bdellovibrionota bacterium]
HTGLINSDFADVKTIMQNKGLALMGIGYGEGEHRAVEAATNAISSPLLEDISIEGATGIIINITGGSNLKIHEVNEATTLIMEAAHEDAEIIFGTVIDESLKDQVKVTVIATGLGGVESFAKEAIAVAAQVAQQSQMQRAQAIAQALETEMSATMQAATPAQEAAPAAPAPVQASVPPPFAAAPAAQPQQQHAQQQRAFDMDEELAQAAPNYAQLATQPQGTGAEGGELARARAIAQRLGITNLTDDEYDVPTYMRRQQEREV